MFDRLERTDGIDNRLIPPGVYDGRAEALRATIAKGIDALPLKQLDVVDFDTVDPQLLPALVRGLSLQEFMFEGITEATVRAFCANAVRLHQRKGTIAGIRFGLDLLNMSMDWRDWYQQEPQAAPNTYTTTIFIGRSIFAEADPTLERGKRAAIAMVDAMKRWSQEGSLRFGVATNVNAYRGASSGYGARYIAGLPGPDEAPADVRSYRSVNSTFHGRYVAALPEAA